jgi:DNA-binding CsgD family transcriptional regulator
MVNKLKDNTGQFVSTWKEEEIEILKAKWNECSSGEIARILHKPFNTVRAKAIALNLGTNPYRLTPEGKQCKKWTKEETEMLKHFRILNLSYEEIARKLKRDVNTVKGKCHRLGLSKISYHSFGITLFKEYAKNTHTKILEVGNGNTPYDVIIEEGTIKIAVNVKVGNLIVNWDNVRRLHQTQLPVRFVWFPLKTSQPVVVFDLRMED